jgi:uncharacterized membrane protein (UPF0136 family)
MSLVSSDISPSVTAQRQHQSNVLMVASLIKVVREKKPCGETLTSINVILTSQIGNRQPDPMGVG